MNMCRGLNGGVSSAAGQPHDLRRSDDRITVRACLGNVLLDVPVLGKPAIYHAEDISDRRPPVLTILLEERVRHDKVVIRYEAGDGELALRHLLEERAEQCVDGGATVCQMGIVLDVILRDESIKATEVLSDEYLFVESVTIDLLRSADVAWSAIFIADFLLQ